MSTTFLNRNKYFLSVFGLLIANFLRFDFYPNEEVQFAFAREFFDPNWITGYSSLVDDLGTRALIRYIIGFTLSIFDWLPALLLLRIVNYIIFAYGLSRLIKQLNLPLIQSLILLELFFISPQCLIAGEWIFGGVEAKTFAYGFIFIALSFYLSKRFNRAICLLILASYFHILVGFWVTVSLLLHFLIFNRKLVSVIKLGGFYSLGLTPLLLFVIFQNQLQEIVVPDSFSFGINYVNFRVPHHTQIFNNYQLFSLTTLGVLLHVSFLFWSVKLVNQRDSTLIELWLIVNSIIMLVILIAMIDEYILSDQLSLFFAIYPYRLSSLSLLLFLLIIPGLLKNYWSTKIIRILAIFCAFLVSYQVYENYEYSKKPASKRDDAFNQVIEFVNHKTSPNTKFLILVDKQQPPHKAFYRLTGRNNYFVFQFTPHGYQYYYDWVERGKKYYLSNNNRNNLSKYADKSKYDYVIADSRIIDDSLEEIASFHNYYLYR